MPPPASEDLRFERGVRTCQSCQSLSCIKFFPPVLGEAGASAIPAPPELLLRGLRQRPVQVIVLTRPEIHRTFQPLGDHRGLRLLLQLAVRLLAVSQVLLHDVVLVLVLGEGVGLAALPRRRGGPEVLRGSLRGVFPDGVAVVDGVVAAAGARVGGRVALLPDAVVGADAEVLHVALDLAVVGLDEVTPGFALRLSARVLQFSPPVREPIAHLEF